MLLATGSVAAGWGSPIAPLQGAQPARDYDVIVLGGGFCGLSAARGCRRAGLRTVILETRNRLGGRTFTADFNGRPTEIGRVFFARADWANGWRGFIDGAIEQGLEAGRRVREMLA